MNFLKNIIPIEITAYRLRQLLKEEGIETTDYRIYKLFKVKKIEKINLDFLIVLKKISGRSWQEVGEILEKIYTKKK